MVAPHPYPDTNGFHDNPLPPPHKKVHGIFYSPPPPEGDPWYLLSPHHPLKETYGIVYSPTTP